MNRIGQIKYIHMLNANLNFNPSPYKISLYISIFRSIIPCSGLTIEIKTNPMGFKSGEQ